MAQKVNIILVDDLDGAEGDTIETVAFGLDGAQYEIDLREENAEALRNALASYVEHGRKVGGRVARKAAGSSSSSSVDKSAVREWAKANGFEVSERGRIPASVEEAYTAAQQVTAKGGTKRGGTAKRTASIEEIEASKAS